MNIKTIRKIWKCIWIPTTIVFAVLMAMLAVAMVNDVRERHKAQQVKEDLKHLNDLGISRLGVKEFEKAINETMASYPIDYKNGVVGTSVKAVGTYVTYVYEVVGHSTNYDRATIHQNFYGSMQEDPWCTDPGIRALPIVVSFVYHYADKVTSEIIETLPYLCGDKQI